MEGPRLIDPGERAVRWIGNLTLCDDFDGRPFELREWQADRIIRPIFGTIREDGRRRYRRVFLFIPRKNAKTQITAGMATYLLLGEKKSGQSIDVAASDREQAAKLFDKVVTMIQADRHLERQVRIYHSLKKIVAKRSRNTLKVLSSEGRRQLGGNSSVVIIDELLAQKDRRLHDALTGGQGTRKDRLVVLISTADNRRGTLCDDEYQYARKVRDGLIDDPAYLPIIFEAEPEDDWKDEATWHKAMPALGDFLDVEFIRDEFRRALEILSEESKFKQYYLNLWVASVQKWLNRAQWDECGKVEIDRESLRGQQCWAGIDLSNTCDVTALVLVFPQEDGSYKVVCRFWIPRKYAEERDAKGATSYLRWAQLGLITLTDRPVIDYDFIFAAIIGQHEEGKPEIVGVVEEYDLVKVLIDPFNARKFAHDLQDAGVDVEECFQGARQLNDPIKQLEVLIALGLMHHGDNKVLNWMADNVVARRDGFANVTFDKDVSAEKIDGMAALVMGLAAAMSPAPPKVEIRYA